MEGLSHYEKQVRPWGNFQQFTLNESSTVKIITVHAREALSLQVHAHRDEFWRVLQGTGTVEIGDTRSEAKSGDTFFVARGVNHRIEGGLQELQVLEIAFGEFQEQDITRLEDRYGRT